MLKRQSGILLHPTSLPGQFGIGDIGPSAYGFIDFLVEAGQKIWQILPLGPTGYGDSPYSCLSAFAGNPMLLSPEQLLRDGFLSPESVAAYPNLSGSQVDFETVKDTKWALLEESFRIFIHQASETEQQRFQNFCNCQHTQFWLHDYALFMALKEHYKNEAWYKWDPEFVVRESHALVYCEKQLSDAILFHKYLQYQFHKQWHELKTYAHLNGIQIMGDIPIFVAHDSADVWAYQKLFKLDGTGNPTVVSGVPPDYFSKTGQLWGNPIYRWDIMKKNHYAWWTERIRVTLSQVDLIRLDHFRGFEAYWEIPAGEETAINGQWVKGPDKDFFEAIEKNLGKLPFIAEDLGVITPEVELLRDRFSLPGMKILQFAFDANEQNNYLPHFFDKNSVVYTGTHDNQTTVGWFTAQPPTTQRLVQHYMDTSGDEIHWDFIRLALASVAHTALIPLQDVLGLNDEQGRMNTPSEGKGNWSWRFETGDLTLEHAQRLKQWVQLYDR